MRLLITRAEPAASVSAAALQMMGHRVICAPVLEPQAQAWRPPEGLPQVILFTSANAARLGGAGLQAYRGLPAIAVGAATAAAARQAGFTDIQMAAGDVRGCLALAQSMGVTTVLHLAGRHRTSVATPEGMTLWVRAVYRARLVGQLPTTVTEALRLGEVDAALLYSVRAARQFAALIDQAGLDRRLLGLVALSPAILAAAGTGWFDGVAAPAPHEAALFAAIEQMCDKEAPTLAAGGKG